MHTIKNWVRGLAVPAVVLLPLGLLTPGAQAATSMTATENVNVRSAPSSAAEIVGGLYRGQTVEVVATTDGWAKIDYDKTTAYVSSAYLNGGSDLPVTSKVDAGAVRVTTAAVNLRTGPGLSYDVIRVVKKGTVVTMTGKTARGFSEVVNGDSTGYISTQYLAKSATGLPAIIGTRVATAALDIRTTSGADAETVAEVKKGTVLSVTGATQNGRAQIIYRKAIRWVTAKYLATPDNNQPTPPKLPAVTGYRYATAELNIRSTYTDDYTLISEVPVGTKLAITAVVKQGRRQIVYEKTVRWVTDKYLSTTKPATGGTGDKYAVEKGLKPNAIKVHRAILKNFPQITVFGGKRADALPDHPSGRALDCMIPNYKSKAGKQLGYDLSRWLRAHADELGINYIIWDQHIWNDLRSSEGWRYMASRGSDSANHKNHVHVTVYAKGYSPI